MGYEILFSYLIKVVFLSPLANFYSCFNNKLSLSDQFLHKQDSLFHIIVLLKYII